MTTEETVTISKADYKELLQDQRFLNCLRGAGVDNWDGYDYAIEAMYGDDEEEET